MKELSRRDIWMLRRYYAKQFLLGRWHYWGCFWDLVWPAPKCPWCAANGIRATLEAVTTDRGEVQRCWQCGGEYKNGNLVWPERQGVEK